MKFVLALVLILSFTTSIAQDKKVLFYDASWKPADAKKYLFIVEQKKLNDTCWEWNYYEAKRPRFLSVQFKNMQGGSRHGKYTSYTYQGFEDTMGYYFNGKKHGEWTVMASNHRILKQLEYSNDVLVTEKDSFRVNKDRAQYLDSLKRTGADTLEVDSELPGGAGTWRQFLTKNFKYPDESLKNYVEGTVWVQFVVDTDGRVINANIKKSVEYYIDTEALRLMNASPKWTPAVQAGKKVKTYKIQPVIFQLQ